MTHLAGSRRPRDTPNTMHIDYADVLRQAVQNERDRLLMDLRRKVAAIDVGNTYSSNRPNPEKVKRDALAILDAEQETR